MRPIAAGIAALVIVACAASSAKASFIIDRTTITATASEEYSAQRGADDVLNGDLGLTGDGGGTTMWITSGNSPAAGQWIKFDLGQPYVVETLKVWNYNAYMIDVGDWLYRGVQTADIQTAGSLADFNANNFTTVTGLANVTFAEGKGAAQTADDYTLVTFPDNTVTQYVNIYVESNFSSNYVGLSEVEFSAHNVPEPATLALLAAGAAMLMNRRRRSR